MSQQNFVLQVRLFMEYGKRNRLTSYERMFWLGLFQIANTLAQSSGNNEWPDDFFPVRNSEITEWTGLEERNIRTIRNRFRQMGLIDYLKGDGKKSDPEYRLFYLRRIGYKIAPGSVTDGEQTGNKIAPDSVGGSVGDSVPDTVTDTVPDGGQTGNKIVPDSAGDPLLTHRNPYVFNNINTNGEPERQRETQRQGQERSPARARARDGGLSTGYPQNFPQRRNTGGFVDLDEEPEYSGGGLVPLP